MPESETVPSLIDELADATAEEVLAAVAERFSGHVAFASSLGAEDQVLTDMIARPASTSRIFTLDTGRLPQETYDLIDATRKRYGLASRCSSRPRPTWRRWSTATGANLFRESVESAQALLPRPQGPAAAPRRCRAGRLDHRPAPRAGASRGRTSQIGRVGRGQRPGQDQPAGGLDEAEQVWEYIRAHDVPYNAAARPGLSPASAAPPARAPWPPGEDCARRPLVVGEPEHKECGLHARGGSAARRRRSGQLEQHR